MLKNKLSPISEGTSLTKSGVYQLRGRTLNLLCDARRAEAKQQTRQMRGLVERETTRRKSETGQCGVTTSTQGCCVGPLYTSTALVETCPPIHTAASPPCAVLCPLPAAHWERAHPGCTTDPRLQPRGSLRHHANQLIDARSRCSRRLCCSSTYGRLIFSHRRILWRAFCAVEGAVIYVPVRLSANLIVVPALHSAMRTLGRRDAPVSLPCSATETARIAVVVGEAVAA